MSGEKRNSWSGRSQHLFNLARQILPPESLFTDRLPPPRIESDKNQNRNVYVRDWLEASSSPAQSVTDSENVIFEEIFQNLKTPAEGSTENSHGLSGLKYAASGVPYKCDNNNNIGSSKEINNALLLNFDTEVIGEAQEEPHESATGGIERKACSLQAPKKFRHVFKNLKTFCSRKLTFDKEEISECATSLKDKQKPLVQYSSSSEDDSSFSDDIRSNIVQNQRKSSHDEKPKIHNEREDLTDFSEPDDNSSEGPNIASNDSLDRGDLLAPDAFQETEIDLQSSSCNSSTERAQRKNSRKRSRDPSMWQSNVRKKLKNSGMEYVSSRFKKFEAKKMRPPCACKFNCVLRLCEEERQKLLDTFWALGDHERQWDFIRKNSTNTSANKDKRKEYKGMKKLARSYYFVVNREKVRVCKHMFMATLSIWDSWIDNAYSHINAEKGNTYSPDKRGKHSNQAIKITQPIIDSVKEHVNSFQRVPSHYCRVRTRKEYLETGLSLAKMARFYQVWALDKGLPKTSIATPRQYITVVNDNFNLGFYKPKKDRCQLCSIITNKLNTRVIREKYKQQFALHVHNKHKARKLKQKDKIEAMKNPTTICVSAFDLQKQLPCPKSDAAPFYYRNKLTVYNFTIFNLVTRIGICNLWHEGSAKKGSNEIASCLWNYIRALAALGFKDVRFYSDNCSGQNKNRFIFAMYVLAAVFFGIQITHRYLEVGHTQMEVDSIHGRIEESTKGKELFDYYDWVKAIEEAKEEAPPYEVKHLNKSNVYDFKHLVSLQNWAKSLRDKQIMWRKIREFSIDGNSDQLVRVKYDLEGSAITMSVNKVGRPVNLKTYVPPVAYAENIPLSANTIRDLRWLCETMAIPITKQQFFRNVIAGCDPTTEDRESDVEYETDDEIFVGDLHNNVMTARDCENEE